jgi:hypothetical protein
MARHQVLPSGFDSASIRTVRDWEHAFWSRRLGDAAKQLLACPDEFRHRIAQQLLAGASTAVKVDTKAR